MKVKEITFNDKHYSWYFICPGCNREHVLDSRWKFNNDLEKPTFEGSVASNCNPEYHNPNVPKCHSYVENGTIRFLTDSTHHLTGKTVELSDIL